MLEDSYKIEINHPRPKEKRLKKKSYAQGQMVGIALVRDSGYDAVRKFLLAFHPRNEFDRGVKDGIERTLDSQVPQSTLMVVDKC